MADNISKKRKQRQKGSSETSPNPKLQKGFGSDQDLFKREPDEVFESLSITTDFMEKLDQIISKLIGIESRLESLESTVKQMDSSMKSLQVNVKNLEDKVKEVDHNLTDLATSTAMMEDEMKDAKTKCFENYQSFCEKTNAVQQKVLYLEAYSRRENLKIFGIPEASKNEEGKETKEILYGFLQTELDMHDAREIEFQRIHRLGRKYDERPRPIIVRFQRFADREYVLQNARRLKGTNYKIYEDFPTEILKKRRKQLDKFYAAKKENQRVHFSKSEPDKLYINGKFQPVFDNE